MSVYLSLSPSTEFEAPPNLLPGPALVDEDDGEEGAKGGDGEEEGGDGEEDGGEEGGEEGAADALLLLCS